MSFHQRIKYFLVHTLKYTNKEAQLLINNGNIKINNFTIFENCVIENNSEIKVNDVIKRSKTEFIYIKFYKPIGFESSLNTGVEHNIASFFGNYPHLSIAGRLDKASQGLLLLSNDGKWVENMCNPKFEKEKEYLVTLNNEIDDAFVCALSNGVKINSTYITKKCVCEKISSRVVKIVLKEGKNRQIRKMCKTLGYIVIDLKRVRIDNFLLNNLPIGKTEFTKI